MPSVPTVSPATGNPVPPYYIHTTGGHFVDTTGRTLMLRGVNLSGDSKYPTGNNSYTLDGFWEGGESGNVSFVNKPFSLNDADVHLERIKGWGMNMIRYVICWEALEHAGPKQYDEAFIDYTIAVLQKCKAHGFKVFIDPHQDVWSRFSGGSGAPFWTLHACGLEPRNFTVTGALLHNEYPDPKNPKPDTFPAMTWPTSYYRLPALTVFTMFFAGRDYAPKCIIDGINIQDYLQGHKRDAFAHLADRLREAGGLLDECVIGWETINEPSEGFIGMGDLNVFPPEQMLKRESSPTPAQSLRLGSGIAQTVEFWTFSSVGPMKKGTVNVDPKGASIWLDPKHEPGGASTKWGWQRDPGWKLGQCVWEQHGIWDKSSGMIKIPDYFKHSKVNPRKKVNFVEEYWFPYWKDWSTKIRASHPEAIIFIQPPLFKPPPKMSEDDVKGRVAYSPHFYDGLTMMTRHWNWFNSSTIPVLRKKIYIVQSFKVGDDNIKKNFLEQLSVFREDVEHNVGSYPIVLGETGTPYDVDGKKSYGRTHGGMYIGNHVQQQKALDASLAATDGTNLYNYTVWAYNPGHTWDHGDGFNAEDLSIWSSDDYVYRRHVKFEKLAKAAAHGTMPAVTIGSQEVPMKDLEDAAKDPGSPVELDGEQMPLPKMLTAPNATAYEFLVDGSRAIAAFCRPYPTKVVGRPTYISYDIAQATFTLSVRVEASDKAPENAGEIATEIYIPLTTFSSPPTLYPVPTEDEDQAAEEAEAGQEAVRSEAASPTPSSTKSGEPLHVSHHRDPNREHSIQEAISRLHMAFAGNRSRAAAGYSLHLSSDPPLPLQVPDDVLDIEVSVSAGEWEVKGQKILWYYGVPDEGSAEQTMTVKKRDVMNGSAARSGKGDGCTVM